MENRSEIDPGGPPEPVHAPGSGLRRSGIDWDAILGGQMGPKGRPNRPEVYKMPLI